MKARLALLVVVLTSFVSIKTFAAPIKPDTTIHVTPPSGSMPNLVMKSNDLMSPLAYNTGDWTYIGPTQQGTSPYPLYYYKLLQLNSLTLRYSSILELTVQGDANYFSYQGTYTIRVDKFENTTGDRFDGMEIRSTSGNPRIATFYVYNDALWVCSNVTWGQLYYRTVADFTNNSPMAPAPFTPVLTAPVNPLISTTDYGLKCDFDNNVFYKLPHYDVLGNAFFNHNVGIGTTDTKGYKLAVNGAGIFTKVKVKEFGTWPDFVFEPAYQLPTLQEVEQYVNTNKHLPDMPSAATIAQEGLDLGEMNRKLLQKVEELTLYLIEGNKKNEALERKLIANEKKNNVLENRLEALEKQQEKDRILK